MKDAPLSTFSIDVDTASYSNVRRMLNGGQLPPRGAVRIEERNATGPRADIDLEIPEDPLRRRPVWIGGPLS